MTSAKKENIFKFAINVLVNSILQILPYVTVGWSDQTGREGRLERRLVEAGKSLGSQQPNLISEK